MSSEITYRGTRWFKCDLHIHTAASNCFTDKTVTAKELVARAIEQGLDCIAVTDHNTGVSIDEVKKAAEGTPLVVFPGVEISCDTSKIHLLVLFDLDKTTADIRDFLVRTDIPSQDFGKNEAASSKNIFDILAIAQTDGAIAIPAHIDEYNGLGSLSTVNLERLFSQNSVNAVQIVHKEYLDYIDKPLDYARLKDVINEYYNFPNPAIDDAKIKEWSTPIKFALKENISLLAFSDNPHAPQDSKHGLWGIGKQFTWIKMDEKPSLEGLRQAFILPQLRIQNSLQNPSIPYKKPNLWIKSISISGTTITDDSIPLKIEFSPQLTTIIGGRGSGKSSILRFIRGVFNRTNDIRELPEIFKDQDDFYKKEELRTRKGVLTEKSIIEIEFARDDTLHRVTASNVTPSYNQEIQIQRLNDHGVWEDVQDEGYIDFLDFEHYSQKQIYEIAQEPNALRDRIDRAITGLDKIKDERERVKSSFLEKSAAIRKTETYLSAKGRLETNLKDINQKIYKLQQSGIADVITSKEKFEKERTVIEKVKTELINKIAILEGIIANFNLSDIDLSAFDEVHDKELRKITDEVSYGLSKCKKELIQINEELSQLKSKYEQSVCGSQWKQDSDANLYEFTCKKEELEKAGIDAISSFEKLSSERLLAEQELEQLEIQARQKDIEVAERNKLASEYLRLSKEITSKRCEFVQSVIADDKVKVEIKQFRNQADYEARLRKILQRETAFLSDLENLLKICFTGKVEDKLNEVRGIFKRIREGEDVSSIVSGHFVNLVKSLLDSQIDEIELLIPEDEIEVKYKTSTMSDYKLLSSASAGQKTTAILTFILSFGENPLILDQPEDDLDNRLVYDLIVDRLKKSKENRQIIVVTHNANIPVNGDAEYIISMDSESKKLKVLYSGTVEQNEIKKEICDVMEGGDKAFELRSKRYKTK